MACRMLMLWGVKVAGRDSPLLPFLVCPLLAISEICLS
jgi:hypothetical protein